MMEVDEASAACDKCQKPQSELSKLLKRCAKCQSGRYCSRECQKAHWPQHKKSCSSQAGAGTPGSLSNPPRDELLAEAMKTMRLCQAFTKDPNFELRNLTVIPTTLRNSFEFCRTTWEDSWRKLLPGTIANEIRWSNDQEAMKEAAAADPRLKSAEWPPFNRETYQDGIGRNVLIANIIQTPEQYDRYGGPYDFPEGVWDAARAIKDLKPGQASSDARARS